MNVAVIVATFGGPEWERLALTRAVASTVGQRATEVIAYHDEAATLARARNTAAAGASADWLCFLDADDELGDGYLDAMRAWWDDDAHGAADAAPPPIVAMLVPSVQYVTVGGVCVGDPEIPAWDRPLSELNCGVIGTLIRREAFEEVGGFHEWPLYEDWDLWQRVAIAGGRMAPVRDAVYCARAGHGGRNMPGRRTQVHVYNEIRLRHADARAIIDGCKTAV